MNGMESLVKTMLKAMGFEPQSFIQAIQGFIEGTHSELASLKALLLGMNSKLVDIKEHLERISPSVPPASCEVDETLHPPVLENVTFETIEERKAA